MTSMIDTIFFKTVCVESCAGNVRAADEFKRIYLSKGSKLCI